MPVERPWIPRVAGVVCITIGVLDVAAAVSPGLWRRVHLLTDVLPGAISQATVAALLAVGIGFMLLARRPAPGASGGPGSSRSCCWPRRVGLHLFGPAPAPRAGRGVVGDARSAGRVPARVLRGRRPVHAVVGAALPAASCSRCRLVVGLLVAYAFRGRFAHRVGFWSTLRYVGAGLVGVPTPLDQQPRLPAGRRVLLAARRSAWSRWARRCSCCCARRGRSRC